MSLVHGVPARLAVCRAFATPSVPLPSPPEDLSAFLMEQGVPTAYLHSGVKPMQRLELLRQLRSGDIDVIVGVNLLREVRSVRDRCCSLVLSY